MFEMPSPSVRTWLYTPIETKGADREGVSERKAKPVGKQNYRLTLTRLALHLWQPVLDFL